VVRVSFACSSVFPPGLPRYAASPPYQHKRLRAVPTRQPSIRSSETRIFQSRFVSQVPEQHRRARPSCRETNHETDARIQVFPVSQKCSGGYRTHAHDTQRSDDGRLCRYIFCRPVLCLGRTNAHSLNGR
jgi:hypothetical protein